MNYTTWREGYLYWATRTRTFKMRVSKNRVVECPAKFEKWAMLRKVEDIAYRAGKHGAVLHWEGPLFEVEE